MIVRESICVEYRESLKPGKEAFVQEHTVSRTHSILLPRIVASNWPYRKILRMSLSIDLGNVRFPTSRGKRRVRWFQAWWNRLHKRRDDHGWYSYLRYSMVFVTGSSGSSIAYLHCFCYWTDSALMGDLVIFRDEINQRYGNPAQAMDTR